MERTDSDWGQASEPVPRGRLLLDRSRLHGRLLEEHRPLQRLEGDPDERPDDGGPEEYPRARPERPGYPVPHADGYREPVVDRYGDLRTDQYRAPRPEQRREEWPDRRREAHPDQYPRQGGYREPRPAAPRDPLREAYPNAIQWRAAEPDPAERFAALLRQDLGRPRVLAFANPKGGVHKTTATVLTAATAGGVRGRGVLAWDDNELRGTLGLRAGSARHARTIRHLVRDLMAVEAASGYELTERLDEYLRHAADGSYDVLAGEESPRFAQRLDPHTVRRVLELLRRTHDVICVDTGNNVESPNWQTVIQAADQLVVTTVPREDAAFTADWMLDLLHEMGMGEIAESAVTLISCPTPNPSPLLSDLTAHFGSRTRAVVVVPYDPALETGSSIDHTVLQPATRRAWLEATAAMLDPFVPELSGRRPR